MKLQSSLKWKIMSRGRCTAQVLPTCIPGLFWLKETHTKIDWVFLPHTVKYFRCSFYRNYQYDLRTDYLTYANLKALYHYILSWQCCSTLNLYSESWLHQYERIHFVLHVLSCTEFSFSINNGFFQSFNIMNKGKKDNVTGLKTTMLLVCYSEWVWVFFLKLHIVYVFPEKHQENILHSFIWKVSWIIFFFDERKIKRKYCIFVVLKGKHVWMRKPGLAAG